MKGESLSLRYLQGTTPGSGGKGFIDLLSHKHALKTHLTTEVLDAKAAWPSDVRALMRQALSSPSTYRSYAGYPKDEADLTWRAGWPASAENFFQLCETLIFLTSHDMPLKVAIKNRKSPEDTLASSGIAEMIEEIDEEYAREKKKAAEEDGAIVIDEEAEPVPEVPQPAHASEELDLAVKEHKKEMADDDAEKLNSFLTYADKLINTHVKLIVENNVSQDALAAQIKDTHACNDDSMTNTYKRNAGGAFSNVNQNHAAPRSR